MAPSTARTPPLSRASLRRQSSAIRTGCANKRPSGSVRGVSREWYPYRDLTDPGSNRSAIQSPNANPEKDQSRKSECVTGNALAHIAVRGWDFSLFLCCPNLRPPFFLCRCNSFLIREAQSGLASCADCSPECTAARSLTSCAGCKPIALSIANSIQPSQQSWSTNSPPVEPH
jgi:hypothetical protein